MFKRFALFFGMNIAVLLMVNIILSLFNVQPYMDAYGINYQSLMIFCLVWGMVGSFISLSLSKWMAKSMMGVQIVDDRGQFAHLTHTVHRLAKAANLPKMPEVGVYNSPEVNAFATGPSKSNSLVAVSTGLLQNMSEQEVEGVLAHEIAHISNGDMVTMALAQGVINAFVMFFARIAAFAIQNALRSDDDDSPVGGMSYFLTAMVFDIIFGLIGAMILATYSRFREYKADAGGAKLAGRDKMIAALKRLQNQYESGGVFDHRNENMNAFKISSKPSGLRALMSTHPALSHRIARLEQGY